MIFGYLDPLLQISRCNYLILCGLCKEYVKKKKQLSKDQKETREEGEFDLAAFSPDPTNLFSRDNVLELSELRASCPSYWDHLSVPGSDLRVIRGTSHGCRDSQHQNKFGSPKPMSI